ncbi:HAMP domain-containing sensor histidine kinase [Pseudomonas sp. SST3]|uniref:HAMP domain-containing sensor histidine kinase n=1 Tax=Pseudomonas sp. SST3 TaxID=2267882 RepID=UPI000E02A08E|nr:sensor histidine kinase [Pseudomonas sp. SST3]NKQ10953.1 sensor histidine kinase [Pseudomonas sp. SST3]
MPNRHSLFWRLVVLVAGFCLSMIWAGGYVGRQIDRASSYLSPEAHEVLADYADQARTALHEEPEALEQWLKSMRQRESSWLVVVDEQLQPLGGQTLNNEERQMITFVRHYEWPMSRRSESLPLVSMPIEGSGARLIMRLPERFRPWRHHALLTAGAVYLPLVLLSVLFCWMLYRLLVSPLDSLRRQANALRGNRLDSLLPPSIARRNDELGELGRSLEYLTQRLRDSITQQQQLLRDLSHELRTPLSRLRVACESELSAEEMRSRTDREITSMQHLVDSTLEFAWLDSEQPRFECEPVEVAALWDVLSENACFESGWPRERIQARVPEDCLVLGNLNALAQAMENILRNAIRYSPAAGTVCLWAEPDGDHWQLHIEDQGSGVPSDQLPVIFRPFARLSAARPGGDGFGLGLAIARSMVLMQGGDIWAENGNPGLRMTIRLRSV